MGPGSSSRSSSQRMSMSQRSILGLHAWSDFHQTWSLNKILASREEETRAQKEPHTPKTKKNNPGDCRGLGTGGAE